MHSSDTTEKELHARGEAVRRQLVGEARFLNSGQTTYADPLMKEFLETTTTAVFGVFWSRPGLDLKTRTLVVCISDITGGHLEELDIHLQMALRMGWSRTELSEAILQLLGYVGAPATRDAMKVASRLFGRLDDVLPEAGE
jgi:4-carboxymuconolactone decarboxylase